ncbi:peptidyl-prolyl cis-trans isomerase CYP59 [Dendrobium catenatum]|uniref:Peptidyl-prolyl cis-trans isomerase n=1 Tax=Dendrobium catenatum TaxID=906689 RepID=A0A2I0XDG5_9ASPA|nr:peptidyl-prolyl cis-trans isomerase CYP59 [Dendrobium catenatum]PKU85934.1 Peptidyl-prolyl cis-trans isomerase-like 2 [Dendrobium catenatum]
MSVMIVTSLGDIVVDLYTDRCPLTTKNFLKLCKMKYYNGCLFHTVEKGFMAQTGDRTGMGNGGDSIYKFLYGEQARFFDDEIHPDLKHSKIGTVAMASAGENCNASQFYITLRDEIDYLDGKHTVFGVVEEKESLDSLVKINESYVDAKGRPFKDIRIKHTYILDDPFDDPSQLAEFVPEKSPEGKPPEEVAEERLEDSWVPMDEKISAGELEEVIRSKEAHTNAAILESIGDIPDAEMKPPDTVLFVCKLNPVTQDEDLYTIFSRFGAVTSADIIRDYKTGDSLCYAFIEFENKDACERAYFKMDNALIDDRRIRVDFSQSVAKLWKHFRHGKRSTKDGCFKCGAPDHIARDCMEEPDGKEEGPKYSLKDANTQHGGHDHKSYDMLFDEEEIENTEQKQSKKIKTSHYKLENPRHLDQDNKSSARHRHEADRSRRHQEDEKDKSNGRDDRRYIDRRTEKNGDREHYRKNDGSKHRTDEGDYKSGSRRDEKDAYDSESYRKDEGEHGKRRAERDRHRRDDRSYERSRDRDEESYRERRHRDGRR